MKFLIALLLVIPFTAFSEFVINPGDTLDINGAVVSCENSQHTQEVQFEKALEMTEADLIRLAETAGIGGCKIEAQKVLFFATTYYLTYNEKKISPSSNNPYSFKLKLMNLIRIGACSN